MTCGPRATMDVTPDDGILTKDSVHRPLSTFYSPPVRMRSSAIRVALVAVLVSGCGHSEPFSSTPERNEGPLLPGNPAQITHNLLQDLRPSWLPDGSGILYTYESSPVENRDRCLAILPPDGGTRGTEICNTSVGHLDSTEAYGPSAVSAGGQLAYSYAQSTPLRVVPNVIQLRVAPLADPQNFTVVHTLPLGVDGVPISGIGDLHWLSDTRLVYLAQSVEYVAPAPGALRDTIINGLAVALVDLQNFPSPVFVPGTETATAVSLGDAPETIVYTLAGDSRVYRKELATGATTVLHDFGTLGIARDAVVQGNRLLAVVGGFVTFTIDPQTGVNQTDLGGLIYQVDLATGQQLQLPDGAVPRLFRQPVISPTGAVAAEGYPFTIDTIRVGGVVSVDTTVSTLADLLLYPAP